MRARNVVHGLSTDSDNKRLSSEPKFLTSMATVALVAGTLSQPWSSINANVSTHHGDLLRARLQRPSQCRCSGINVHHCPRHVFLYYFVSVCVCVRGGLFDQVTLPPSSRTAGNRCLSRLKSPESQLRNCAPVRLLDGKAAREFQTAALGHCYDIGSCCDLSFGALRLNHDTLSQFFVGVHQGFQSDRYGTWTGIKGEGHWNSNSNCHPEVAQGSTHKSTSTRARCYNSQQA